MRWPWFREKGRQQADLRESDAAEARAGAAGQAEETGPPDRRVNTSPASFVTVFQDTQRSIQQDTVLAERARRLAAKTTVYPPGFRSAKIPRKRCCCSAWFCEHIEAFQSCFLLFPPTAGRAGTLDGNKRWFF